MVWTNWCSALKRSNSATIQRRTSDATDVITVQIEEQPPEVVADLTQDFADAAGVSTTDISFAFTSSTWGSEITEKALRALVIFLVVVALFISVRFEWRMAVAALAAMAHDVLVTVGVYSICGPKGEEKSISPIVPGFR